jgi:hypothetical protein
MIESDAAPKLRGGGHPDAREARLGRWPQTPAGLLEASGMRFGVGKHFSLSLTEMPGYLPRHVEHNR